MSQVQQLASSDLPPMRDFVLSAGFAGVAAVLAAVIVSGVVLYGSRRANQRFLAERDQRDRQHDERRLDAQHAAAVERCWQRWWHVLETAAIEPAASEGTTLGLGPEVALVVLQGLLRDADQLGDETLTKAIAVYREQLVLVLAQQSGPLSNFAEPAVASTHGELDLPPPATKQPSLTPGASGSPPSGSATSAAAEPASAEPRTTTAERTDRRRR
jgi:hypothetical protein